MSELTESRRDFLKKAALLSGAAVFGTMPESIRRALEISPELGSTFWDAEHVVILMQENRSFDHSYGMLRGVRGFNDPRAHVLPNGNPVWAQTNKLGEAYAPFRLDIKGTNITWLGGLPHTWANQTDARNDGGYDKWLIVKSAGYRPLASKPMTLGHYTRDDIPFYYAFADAFTICDQHFCSSLTGTTSNRLYLWTGTIRPEQKPDAKAHVYNEETDHDSEVSWTTFPERLEAAGISWRVYQNELDIETGLKGVEDEWLANFGCNPLEYFTQFNVRLTQRHRQYLDRRAAELDQEIEAAEKVPEATRDPKLLPALRAEQDSVKSELVEWTAAKWDALSAHEKAIHTKAFTVNEGDADFRLLDSFEYEDGGESRQVKVPKGDLFHQFRQDVQTGNLPTVSWLVGPEHFSDHPTSAWFGAWYVSEALDILTKNPEVWKKTIFILTYDENDGYFDHVPPFVAPNPYRANSGKVSEGIDAKMEFITKEQDLAFRPKYKPRESSLGLGFRVPMVIASPWTRGGCVCSQVFDHTSPLQFLEQFLSKKTGKPIHEPNITTWRRTVCGDLTSVFQDDSHSQGSNPQFLQRDEVVETIDRARFKAPPSHFKPLTEADIQEIKESPKKSANMPTQESGTRKSCPLPYELHVNGQLSSDLTRLEVRLGTGKHSQGSPFNAYAYVGGGKLQSRAYAVASGDELADDWLLSDFENGNYHLRIDGPNGFMREFKGQAGDPQLEVLITYGRNGALEFTLSNRDNAPARVLISDLSYGSQPVLKIVKGNAAETLTISTQLGQGWYDLNISVNGYATYSRRYAGRAETGKWGVTDPAMA